MERIISYKQLKAWQKSIYLVELVYQISRLLPPEEKYILISQMLRSAISIPSNIAEGFGRASKKEKKQFLTISFSSCLELETQLIIVDRIYPNLSVDNLLELNIEIQKMLSAYIRQMT